MAEMGHRVGTLVGMSGRINSYEGEWTDGAVRRLVGELDHLALVQRALVLVESVYSVLGDAALALDRQLGDEPVVPFLHMHDGVTPDLLIVGKALSGGFYPVSAVLASREVLGVFQPGDHGSTFGGNPLACRVGCTVLEIIEEQGLLENARVQGERLLTRLRAELTDNPNVLAIRGQGLMIGIELKQPIRDLTLIAARDHGLLINVTRGKTIRLLPPLTITRTS